LKYKQESCLELVGKSERKKLGQWAKVRGKGRGDVALKNVFRWHGGSHL
jgi:hypothetical protein